MHTHCVAWVPGEVGRAEDRVEGRVEGQGGWRIRNHSCYFRVYVCKRNALTDDVFTYPRTLTAPRGGGPGGGAATAPLGGGPAGGPGTARKGGGARAG